MHLTSRFTMDGSVRFLPVGTAEKCIFSRELGTDDNRAMQIPAFASRELAPFVDIAGIGRVSQSNSLDGVSESAAYIGDRRSLSSSIIGRSASGKANAKRAGGKLRPVTVNLTNSRKRTPMIRRCAPSASERKAVRLKNGHDCMFSYRLSHRDSTGGPLGFGVPHGSDGRMPRRDIFSAS